MSEQKNSAMPLSAGRPRKEEATDAVRKAALELAQEGGITSTTIEGIARRSGVAKTTIYRRWPNSAAVVMDAFLQEMSPLIAYRRQPTLRLTLASTLKQLVVALRGPRGVLLKGLLGAAQTDPDLQRAFQNHWIGPRREQAMAVLAQARSSGELPPHVDGDLLIDSLYGAVYYRLMIPYAELSEEFVDDLVQQIFSGVIRP